MSLDSNPLLGSNNSPISQTQDQHIAQFNSLNKIMASWADYYDAGKTGDDALIASLRKDFKDSYIVTSDRLIYDANSLEGTIISYYASNIITPIERKVLIPDYSNGPVLDTVLGTEQGLAYIQSLFNTTDNIDEIRNTLNRLSGYASGSTRVWTPDQKSRAVDPNRAAFLGCSVVSFRIGSNGSLSSSSRSRGVSSSPAGTALGKKTLKQISVPDNSLPYKLIEGIDKKNNCVYLSNIQDIGKFSKYSGLFCFYKNRFVLCMTANKFDSESIDNKVAHILASQSNTTENLNVLEQEFNPIYAHLQRYEKTDANFTLMDDAESFSEPKIGGMK